MDEEVRWDWDSISGRLQAATLLLLIDQKKPTYQDEKLIYEVAKQARDLLERTR